MTAESLAIAIVILTKVRQVSLQYRCISFQEAALLSIHAGSQTDCRNKKRSPNNCAFYRILNTTTLELHVFVFHSQTKYFILKLCRSQIFAIFWKPKFFSFFSFLQSFCNTVPSLALLSHWRPRFTRLHCSTVLTRRPTVHWK